MSDYHPEPYWSEVADKIAARGDENVVAGDDEPYYRYKRRAFLKLLNSVNFKDKKVLEIGNGPGGNLREVWKHKPESLTGVDISQQMVDLAKKHNHSNVRIIKINGTELPFEEQSFDIVFTATVLQHNTDEEMLKKSWQNCQGLAKIKCIYLSALRLQYLEMNCVLEDLFPIIMTS